MWRRTRKVRLMVEIEALIAARAAAHQTKDFVEADRIRDELAGHGVVLKDSPEGTTWRGRLAKPWL